MVELLADHHLLQRLIVRLLHDPKLVDAVYTHPRDHLTPLGISEEAQRWLLDIDPRRWKLDPERPHRSLEGAITHCPVTISVWIAFCECAQLSGAEELLSFFESAHFHECIQQRGYLADALISWIHHRLLAIPADSPLQPIIQPICALIDLERSVLELRRLPHSPQRAGEEALRGDTLSREAQLDLAPHVRIFSAYRGCAFAYSTLYQNALQITQAQGQAALLIPVSEHLTPVLSIEITQREELLIERVAEGAAVEALSSGLAQVLRCVQGGCLVSELIDLLVASEVSEVEGVEMIEAWILEELITLVQPIER